MIHIIAIEDDLLIGRMYCKKLEDAGYKVSLFSNGKEALAAIRKSPPTLILTDLVLPEMSGLEILTALKKDKKNSKIPVVFLSNLSKEDEEIRMALEMGAISYLLKVEMSPEEIVARVKEYVEAYAPKNLLPESAAERLKRIKR